MIREGALNEMGFKFDLFQPGQVKEPNTWKCWGCQHETADCFAWVLQNPDSKMQICVDFWTGHGDQHIEASIELAKNIMRRLNAQ